MPWKQSLNHWTAREIPHLSSLITNAFNSGHFPLHPRSLWARAWWHVVLLTASWEICYFPLNFFLIPELFKSVSSFPGFPGGSAIENLPAKTGDARDTGLIPGSGRSSGGGNGSPLQYSCLENPMDRGAWRAIVHRVAKESDLSW